VDEHATVDGTETASRFFNLFFDHTGNSLSYFSIYFKYLILEHIRRSVKQDGLKDSEYIFPLHKLL
jgi:hypothetical protein